MNLFSKFLIIPLAAFNVFSHVLALENVHFYVAHRSLNAHSGQPPVSFSLVSDACEEQVTLNPGEYFAVSLSRGVKQIKYYPRVAGAENDTTLRACETVSQNFFEKILAIPSPSEETITVFELGYGDDDTVTVGRGVIRGPSAHAPKLTLSQVALELSGYKRVK